MTCHLYPDLGGAKGWLKICFIQSEALPRGKYDNYVISMLFLWCSLRHHIFVVKPVMALQNASCFLGLKWDPLISGLRLIIL